MSIQSLAQLESRLQNLIDKLELSRMELEELKVANKELEEENKHLKHELHTWSEKVSSILGKLNTLADEEELEPEIQREEATA
ncbi:cell division protein ZapB [Candidatus Sororendozoicomonas aggregata]|uniref:cell division protein ZapB n=1 Tax=Candidatus Sororendozoicomonas aggregata TaxID=3073239 RepID=UPI002ED22C78